MRVLVIGASGFVGRHLMALLPQRWPQAEIRGVGRGDGVDLLRPQTIDDVVARFRPTHLVHLAAESSVPDCENAPERAVAVNAAGAFAVARALLREAPAAWMLFVSSSEVYGRNLGASPVAETVPVAPRSVYGGTKAAAEALLAGLLGQGLRLIVARPFSHTGPGQSRRFAVPAFAWRIAEAERQGGGRIETGRLDTVRDFLDVRDVCRAYVALLEAAHALVPGEVFNVASGEGRRMETILQRLLAEARAPIEHAVEPDRVRPADIPCAIGCAAKLAARTGWRPLIPFDRTLREVLADARRRLEAGTAGP